MATFLLLYALVDLTMALYVMRTDPWVRGYSTSIGKIKGYYWWYINTIKLTRIKLSVWRTNRKLSNLL